MQRVSSKQYSYACPCNCFTHTDVRFCKSPKSMPSSQVALKALNRNPLKEQAIENVPAPIQQSNHRQGSNYRTGIKPAAERAEITNDSRGGGENEEKEKEEEEVAVAVAEQVEISTRLTDHDQRMAQISYRHKIMDILALIQQMKAKYCHHQSKKRSGDGSQTSGNVKRTLSTKNNGKIAAKKNNYRPLDPTHSISGISNTVNGVSGMTGGTDFVRKPLYIARKPLVRDFEKESSRRDFNREYSKAFRQYI